MIRFAYKAITHTVFKLDTSYFIRRLRIKDDTYSFRGHKVKGQVTCHLTLLVVPGMEFRGL